MREKIIYIIILILVLFGGIFGTYSFLSNGNNTPTSTISKNVTITSNDSISESVDKVYDSVVVIKNYQNGRVVGYGSGFIYKKDDKYGYVMTNNHVVDGASEIKVVLSNDEEVSAKVLGTDSYVDVAVVQIDAKDVAGVAEIGDSTKSKVGDTIFTVGTPVSLEYSGTVTKGIISYVNREMTVSNNGSRYMMEAIQIDASINPGNSGGPLVNINGQVIGVNSIKLVESSIEGMGFAIPIEVAMSQVEKLEKGVAIERPVMGVSTYDVETALAYGRTDLKLGNAKDGVIVTSVQDGSDAKTAGVEVNDIITKMDGKNVESSVHLKFLLYKHNIGDSIKLTVLRDGKEKELTIKLTHKMGETNS